MGQREAAEHARAGTREVNDNLAAVVGAARPSYVAVSCQPVYEFNRAVMLQLEPRSKLADSRLHLGWKAFDSEQNLVLLRLELVAARLLLAEMKIAADLVTKVRQGPVFRKR